MSDKNLPAVRPYHPTTFLERGVAVPFTTPLLAGTRARPADKQGLELVIPNPSGGRGVYIMAWTSISSLCCPTLHDRQLNERIATLTAVTPTVIRRVGRDVAAEGLAGEEATDAARKAAEHDKGDRLLANYLLLMALVGQVDLSAKVKSVGMGDALEIQKRARLAVEIIAPRLGQSTDWVASALEAIADAMASIGINPTVTINHESATSRVPRLIKDLEHCSRDVAEWSRKQLVGDQASYAEMMCSVADYTLKLADETLRQARGLTNDVVGLLRSWAVDRDRIIRLAGRPEWLLDGWEQICLLWSFATDDAARRAALVEMVQLVPILPREAREWADVVVEADMSLRRRKLIPLNEDWQSGATVFELIARNEHIRALTC